MKRDPQHAPKPQFGNNFSNWAIKYDSISCNPVIMHAAKIGHAIRTRKTNQMAVETLSIATG
jgi:hypothetical protein